MDALSIFSLLFSLSLSQHCSLSIILSFSVYTTIYVSNNSIVVFYPSIYKSFYLNTALFQIFLSFLSILLYLSQNNSIVVFYPSTYLPLSLLFLSPYLNTALFRSFSLSVYIIICISKQLYLSLTSILQFPSISLSLSTLLYLSQNNSLSLCPFITLSRVFSISLYHSPTTSLSYSSSLSISQFNSFPLSFSH